MRNPIRTKRDMHILMAFSLFIVLLLFFAPYAVLPTLFATAVGFGLGYLFKKNRKGNE